MFITFEGPDGSGKTTQLRGLADFLCQHNYQVLTTREPGGTAISEQIRSILFDLKNTQMVPRTEILLFLASRAQLVEQVIRPYLAGGGIVLCDRYADSTLAYQGYGHQVNLDQLKVLIDFATGGLKPDLTFLLDLEVEEGLRRREQGGDWNRLDAYAQAFHQRVRQGFLELARQEPQRWVIVDAGQPVDRVQQAIRQEVARRLEIQL
jgi:dTMP kinase